MAWAKVDDKLHSSPKWLGATKGARALWVSAASWCAAQENDGYVPSSALRLFSGTRREASCLVSVGLWDDDENDGWHFHDWTDYNPDSGSQKAKRKAESAGGRRGNHTRWHEKQGLHVEGCEFCEASGTRSGGRVAPESSRPDPTRTRTPTNSSRSTPAPRSDARTEPPSDGPEHSPNSVLASHGMTADERRAFLGDLKADDEVRSVSGLINGLHRKGTLGARINEWRELRDIEPTRRRTPTDRQAQILAAEMQRAHEADARVIPLQQIEGAHR
ncbi:hypothetical protein GCM10025865_00970 [Paraoerskovia sediminicola]|uniref:Uncharacterized protein n=1 Tax=Paraoerskovia sediminicola TaxID=1138587 RepID=A0ABN6X7M0_9CELL|nr:hypothetical protein [Paraoerskovia sediminicola]BDZ40798.1 hypothetical protein GCM10025865_00970 [Paraoerskovia sediminicola]